MTRPGANEDRFLGGLLGMAIGDALGMPVEGWSRQHIAERFNQIDSYHPKSLPDGSEIKAGEFTDETELALCIVESVTTNRGEFEPDNIGSRMLFLARGESRRWLGPDTLAALTAADASLQFQVPLNEDGPATGDVATRGVPVGLMASVGQFDAAKLRNDAEIVTRLTHGSPAAIAAVTAVAYGVNLAARREVPPERWAADTAEFLAGGELAGRLIVVDKLLESNVPSDVAANQLGTGAPAVESVAFGFYAAMNAKRFEESVFAAVNGGGDTDTTAAIAGALAGTAAGASGIPQRLIDELEGRIYVSLAAPWFHRTALQRAGLIINLRLDE